MPSNHLILSSPSPPVFNLFKHQGLFQRVSFSHQVAKVLELQLQHHSFQWIFRTVFLNFRTDLISLQSKGLSRVFSNTTVLKYQFFSTQLLYGTTLTSIFSQLLSIPDFSEAPLDLPEITGTSRGNQGFPAPTRKRPRESFFNSLEVRFPYHDSRAMTRSP